MNLKIIGSEILRTDSWSVYGQYLVILIHTSSHDEYTTQFLEKNHRNFFTTPLNLYNFL